MLRLWIWFRRQFWFTSDHFFFLWLKNISQYSKRDNTQKNGNGNVCLMMNSGICTYSMRKAEKYMYTRSCSKRSLKSDTQFHSEAFAWLALYWIICSVLWCSTAQKVDCVEFVCVWVCLCVNCGNQNNAPTRVCECITFSAVHKHFELYSLFFTRFVERWRFFIGTSLLYMIVIVFF